MTLKENLLTVGDVYAAAIGVSRARVSTIVLNRGATLDAIANGKADVTTGTFEKAMAWFSKNWPPQAAWPEGITRPAAPPALVALVAGGPNADPSGPAFRQEAAE